MKKWKHQEKISIVMEFINTNISMVDLCRKHNLAPSTFSRWKEAFLEGGKQSLSDSGSNPDVRLRRENDSLKKLVDEITFANDVLKKILEEGKR